MKQSSSKQKQKDQPLKVQAIIAKNECSICKKVGNYESWSVCCQDNLRIFCIDCLRKKKCSNPCPIQNCISPSQFSLLQQLLEERRFWYQKVENMIHFKAKLENSLSYFTKLQTPTYSLIKQIIKNYLEDEKKIWMKHFQNYISFFAQYVVKLKSQKIKSHMMKRIEAEDKKLDLVLLEYQKILNLFLLSSTPAPISQKKIYEIPSITISCGVCFLQCKTKHAWKYCRENHPQFLMCDGCINKIDSCPLCRKEMRKKSFKICQAAYDKWISIYKQALSLTDTSNKLVKNKMSIYSVQAMCNKVIQMSSQTSQSLYQAFGQLIQQWIYQWIKQKSRYLQVIYLIVISENQYLHSYDEIKHNEECTILRIRKQLKMRKQQQKERKLLRLKQIMKSQNPNAKQLSEKSQDPLQSWLSESMEEKVARWRKNRQRSNQRSRENQRERSRDGRSRNNRNTGLLFDVNPGPTFFVDY